MKEEKKLPVLPVTDDTINLVKGMNKSPIMSEMADSMNPNNPTTIRTVESKDLKKDHELYLFAKKGSNFMAVIEKYKIVDQEGKKITLEPEDKGSEKARAEIAELIVNTHEKEIRDQAVEVTKKALSRKSLKVLLGLRKNQNEGKKSKLKTRAGCVFLEIGDQSVTL